MFVKYCGHRRSGNCWIRLTGAVKILIIIAVLLIVANVIGLAVYFGVYYNVKEQPKVVEESRSIFGTVLDTLCC